MTALFNTRAREETSLLGRRARITVRPKQIEGFDRLDLFDRGWNKQLGRLALLELPMTITILKPTTMLPPVPLNPGICS